MKMISSARNNGNEQTKIGSINTCAPPLRYTPSKCSVILCFNVMSHIAVKHNALLFKSLLGDFFPFLAWAKIWVAVLEGMRIVNLEPARLIAAPAAGHHCCLQFVRIVPTPVDSLDIAPIYPPPFLTQLSKCPGCGKRLKLTHSSLETIFNFLPRGGMNRQGGECPNTSCFPLSSADERVAAQIWTTQSCLTIVSILDQNRFK